MTRTFTEEQLKTLVARAASVAPDEVTVKIRDGSQIKANALWEGSCGPSRPRTRVGVFCSSNNEQIAIEGAVRRLTMGVSFPEAILVLFDAAGSSPHARVFGYPDSQIAVDLARCFGVAVEQVSRPAVLMDARPPRTIDATEVLDALKLHPNIILQGPPGTGKSTLAIEAIRSLVSDSSVTVEDCRYSQLVAASGGDPNVFLSKLAANPECPPVVWEMVQLHPGYAYEDLVQRLVPQSVGNGFSFVAKDMLLVQLCKVAALREATRGRVVLILDEINRANLGSILGEFVFALDAAHRGEAVSLPYRAEGGSASVYAPSNLSIVGTMNTADRSLALVDYALRRRFHFIDVLATEAIIRNWYAAHSSYGAVATNLFQVCNSDLPDRLKVGHGAFLVPPMPAGNWPERMARCIAFNVAPVLMEYSRESLRPSAVLELPGGAVSLDNTNEVYRSVLALARAGVSESTQLP